MSEEMQRVIKGKKGAYALPGTKPSGTHSRRARQHGLNRISYFEDCKRLPELFRGITSQVKQDNEQYFKCTWKERSGQATRGLEVTRKGFYEQQRQHELTE